MLCTLGLARPLQRLARDRLPLRLAVLGEPRGRVGLAQPLHMPTHTHTQTMLTRTHTHTTHAHTHTHTHTLGPRAALESRATYR